MKNIFYIIVLVITQITLAQGNFEKGNDLYQKGKYKEAIAAYESILQNKQQSAEVYFNLGNCYYKLNQVAPAIYNYEKALVLHPENEDVLNNLKFAQKKTIDEIKEVPKVGFAKLLRDFTGIYHYNTWAWMAVVFATVFLLCFLGYYFSQITLTKRAYFYGMFFFLLAVLVSVSAALFEKSHFENEKPAIVFAAIAEVYSEPQKASTTAMVLHEGTKVYVMETVSNWKKIQLTDGTEGWIESRAIKEVK
ncbi:tetratricopeptide repeat protein [Flavobacterium sp. UMI-01]|uniref:tetratricopeptide repeat protein n=1 Tax=Flavobacterium sp. UMI-01 TaxID=1441053 RepID=UPI001C7D41BD|nr:tetratricopeptide repeat protein [Flavobacterium sp. UMI-01]GIZ07808.1 BatE protein [Flavobacterium sp. UMI-01]